MEDRKTKQGGQSWGVGDSTTCSGVQQEAGSCLRGPASLAVWPLLGQCLSASKQHVTYPPEEAEHR